jgi:hypothetical protein
MRKVKLLFPLSHTTIGGTYFQDKPRLVDDDIADKLLSMRRMKVHNKAGDKKLCPMFEEVIDPDPKKQVKEEKQEKVAVESKEEVPVKNETVQKRTTSVKISKKSKKS